MGVEKVIDADDVPELCGSCSTPVICVKEAAHFCWVLCPEASMVLSTGLSRSSTFFVISKYNDLHPSVGGQAKIQYVWGAFATREHARYIYLTSGIPQFRVESEV